MSLRLASPFQDHAVLQRDQMLPVWGWAPPGTRVRVTLAGRTAVCPSTETGEFSLRLPALPAGGPHTLAVEIVESGERIEIRDLLIGEVWLASGQSNMNWTLEQCRPLADADIATADFPAIRFFNVARRAHLGPHREVDGRWQVATPVAAPNFSAVAFSFARRLHRELGVPVGVLSASWGGTIIESWMSRSALALSPVAAGWLARFEAEAWAPAKWETLPELGADGRVNNYPKDPGLTRDWQRADLDDSAWPTLAVPATWQSAGHHHSGVFWFRRTLEIPADWVGRELVLQLGAADKQDITFVNGAEIGRTGREREEQHWNKPRTYAVPAALVKDRRLVVASRVYSFVYDGGLIGPAAAMKLHPVGRPEAALPLAGEWKLRCEHDLGTVEIVRPMGHGEPNTPHMLFDNLLAPLVPYALRGAIWYQGESNETAAEHYARLLRDLVGDWRRQWGRGDLAFHLVQLPAFRSPQAHEPASRWARLREAQASILELPHTGVAIALERGQADDIHPIDKAPVGERLAQSALARTYGRELVPNGPRAVRFTVDGGSMRVGFEDTGAGLCTLDGAAPRLFLVAGEDGVFHPAEARIEGASSLVVTSPAVPRPVAVRYAWADNPEGANLANREALPASPFRSDAW